jgi:glycerol-3-phosphate O-acyltransferase
VYLLQARGRIERAILEAHIDQEHGNVEALPMPHPRGDQKDADWIEFDRRLSRADDPILLPTRVIWLPPSRETARRDRVRDLLLGDPRRPPLWRQTLLRGRTPKRYQVVSAEGATLSELKERYSGSGVDRSRAFSRFVARQAILALERAEYRILGAQYKVPRLVHEEIEASVRFEDGVAQLAEKLGREVEDVRKEAVLDLHEMAAGYSRFFIDFMARLGRLFIRPGYGEDIDYVPEQVESVRSVFEKYPSVVLPSHKSQLDGLVVARALHDNGLPPTHIFAGINMSFGPLGRVLRRMGRIFIRRSLKDDPVYRWMLREYVGYLLEKRFHLEWYIEGTRSRTGKLMPPKMGLLRYVVDANIDGRSDDVALVPVSIMYDELHEVVDYSAEARGASKEAEGIGWALKFYRAQRGHFGKIYVRFGEPLFLNAALAGAAMEAAEGGEPEDAPLDLQKVAFEISWRINFVTPITASALISLVLLAVRDRAVTLTSLHDVTSGLLERARRRGLSIASSAEGLATPDGIEEIIASMAANGTVEAYSEGAEPVYRVAPGHHLDAAFYRNTSIHYFVNGAILEVALIHASEQITDRVEAFWDEAFRLRDILKFEFFFKPKEEFRKIVDSQINELLPEWESRLLGVDNAADLLEHMHPLLAFPVLRPFIEAYDVVALALESEPPDRAVVDKDFMRRCLGLGNQLALEGRIRSSESVSTLLFGTGLQLAANRNLTEPASDLALRRRQFAAELKDLGRRIDLTEEFTYAGRGQHVGDSRRSVSDWTMPPRNGSGA